MTTTIQTAAVAQDQQTSATTDMMTTATTATTTLLSTKMGTLSEPSLWSIFLVASLCFQLLWIQLRQQQQKMTNLEWIAKIFLIFITFRGWLWLINDDASNAERSLAMATAGGAGGGGGGGGGVGEVVENHEEEEDNTSRRGDDDDDDDDSRHVRWQQEPSIWRRPPIRKPASDPGGVFSSLLLIPMLCLAISKTTTTTATTRNHQSLVEGDKNQEMLLLWQLYGIVISVLSYTCWEGQHRRTKMMGWTVVFAMLVMVALEVSKTESTTTTTKLSVLILSLVWLSMYHSMETLRMLPKSVHGVFTKGEWIIVTSIFSIAITEYIAFSINASNNNSTTTAPTHATIAMAGVLSVLLTGPIMGFLRRAFACIIDNIISTGRGRRKLLTGKYEEILALLFQLPFWIGVPLLGVEGLEFYWLRQQQTPSTSLQQQLDYLSHQLQQFQILGQHYNLSIPTWLIPKSLVWLMDFLLQKETPIVATSSLPEFPRYVWILHWVLILAITIPFAPTTTTSSSSPSPSPSPSQHEEEEPQSSSVPTTTTTTTTTTEQSPNDNTGDGVAVQSLPEPSTEGTPNSSGSTSSNNSVVVLMRKYFHGIAVLLFVPVTIMAPKLLSLSYAIAFAILIVLEYVRPSFPTILDGPFFQQYLDRTKDCCTASTTTTAAAAAAAAAATATATAMTSSSTAREATPLVSSSLIQRQQEGEGDDAEVEAEVGGDGGGLVISHMALIVGCALPLWIGELVLSITSGDKNKNELPLPTLLLILLLQLWGVLCLGIGDAMGALVGVLVGKIKWSPHNSRTVEGSLAMWLSLILSSWLVLWMPISTTTTTTTQSPDHDMDSNDNTTTTTATIMTIAEAMVSFFGGSGEDHQLFPGLPLVLPVLATVTFVTLLEAHTFQIDNLVLPLAGALSLLLFLC